METGCCMPTHSNWVDNEHHNHKKWLFWPKKMNSRLVQSAQNGWVGCRTSKATRGYHFQSDSSIGTPLNTQTMAEKTPKRLSVSSERLVVSEVKNRTFAEPVKISQSATASKIAKQSYGGIPPPRDDHKQTYHSDRGHKLPHRIFLTRCVFFYVTQMKEQLIRHAICVLNRELIHGDGIICTRGRGSRCSESVRHGESCT